MSNTAPQPTEYRTETGAMGGRYVFAKLASMRKERRWSVNPTDRDTIIIQANGAIGEVKLDGTGVLTTKGGYFPHLAIATPYKFPAEFVAACLRICQPQDAETTDRGVTIAHTIAVI